MANDSDKNQASSKDVYQFYKKIKNKINNQLILLGLLIFITLEIINFLTNKDSLSLQIQLLIIISSIAIFAILIITVKTLFQPMFDLLKAIGFVLKPNPSIKPPLPNQSHYQKVGFDKILKYIYATQNKVETNNPTNDDSTTIIANSLNQITFGIIVFDSRQKIIFNNQPAQQFINYQGELNLDINQDISVGEWISDCQKNSITKTKKWNKIFVYDEEKDIKHYYDLEASFKKDNPAETILTLIDRTDFYSPEEQDFEFIAFAAHELRGPITIIRGYLDILSTELKSTITPENNELINRMIVSANKLSGYVNNILNVSRYDRKHLQLYIHPETVDDIISEIKDDIDLRASTQQRILNYELAQNLPKIAADKSSISEVLINLVDNAIKYSSEGSIINLKVYQQGEFVNFEVEDHGIGMPSNVINNLFKKFYRSHRSRETVSGTGIGLYISKAIIDSHGGYINVKSEPEKGSTFTISLPTFDSVADKIRDNQGTNQQIIKSQSDPSISNHGMWKG